MLSYSMHSLDTVKEGSERGNLNDELLLADQAGIFAKIKSQVFERNSMLSESTDPREHNAVGINEVR